MNKTIERIIRKELLSLLEQLPKNNIEVFRRAFAHKLPASSMLKQIVNAVESDKLDAAFSVCERTIMKQKL